MSIKVGKDEVMDSVVEHLTNTFNDLMEIKDEIDTIECDYNFLNEQRLLKVKNNIEIYNDELKRLFLNNALLDIKKNGKTISLIFFSYDEAHNGLVIASKHSDIQNVHGGTFEFNKDGVLLVSGAVSNEEYNIISPLLDSTNDDFSKQDYLTRRRSIADNTVIDMAAMILYIDFLSKYKKEFITVSNKAVVAKKNPKKKKSKGAAKRKVNLVKRIVIQSNKIKEYEKEHSVNIYERHIESWTVAGHWRKIKGGKEKVWIAPYVKGDANKKKGKIYKVK